MHNHRVIIVDDDALPDGTDWALAQHRERHVMFLRAGAQVDRCVSEAWTTFHANIVGEALQPMSPTILPSPRRGGGLRTWSALALSAMTAAGIAVTAAGGVSLSNSPVWASAMWTMVR